VRIVCSKNRLAPLKKVTFPRLEVIAALIEAHFLHYVCKETGHEISEAILWSDSTVALRWICNDPNRWKTFVVKLLTEIQTYIATSKWKLSRGGKPGRSPVTWGHNRALKQATNLGARPSVAVKGSVSLAKPANMNAAPIAG
jgi:hypothetical protein